MSRASAPVDVVVGFLPTLRAIAWKRELPDNGVMDRDDMVQEAAIGALGALKTFDPARGVKLSTHVGLRANFAISDAQREIDPAPRSWRKSQKIVTRARMRLVRELDRLPTPEELAEALGLTPQELRDIDERCLPPSSLEQPLARTRGEADPLTLGDIVVDAEPLPDELVEAREEAERLHAAIDKLTSQEAFIIRATWFGDMTLQDVGEIFGVTQSRISQIRARALKDLATLLER